MTETGIVPRIISGIVPGIILKLKISRVAVLGVLVAAVVGYLLIAPLGMLLFSSFRTTADKLPFEATSFTLSNYVHVFTSPLTYRLFVNTAEYAIIALVIGLGLAIVIAWFVERTNAPGRTFLVTMALAY